MGDVIVVGWCCYDDIVRVCVSRGGVRCRLQGGGAICQICLDAGILNGGDAVVNFGNPVLVDIDGDHVIVLGEQAGKRKAYIAKACDGDVHRYLPAKLTF